MKVYWMGAGGSCSYSGSKTGARPPLASNLFNRFFDLEIAEDPQVIVGMLVNYVRDTRGIPAERFGMFNENAEDFLTELDEVVNHLAPLIPKIHKSRNAGGGFIFANFAHVAAAYDQSVWLFARVLNEIQNGDLSAEYLELLRQSSAADHFVSFNWDTLLDRCMYESGEWFPDTGYGVEFLRIFDAGWRRTRKTKSDRLLLKLHGSTNWLVPYLSRSLENGKRSMLVPGEKGYVGISAALVPERIMGEDGTVEVRFKPDIRTGPAFTAAAVPTRDEPSIRPLCYVRDSGPFETYRDRYKGGYSDFAYYYPPSHPVTHAQTMPLMIPPTRRKLYQEFGFVFRQLWSAAKRNIKHSDELVIIGFSFPEGDQRARALLADAIRRRTRRLDITVVNPEADAVIKKLRSFLPSGKFRVKRKYKTFSDYLAASAK
jgi:hypothetical protein